MHLSLNNNYILCTFKKLKKGTVIPCTKSKNPVNRH